MADPSGEIDPDRLRERLPNGWRIEMDGGVIHGYMSERDAVDGPASFSIQRSSDHLWTATWLAPANSREHEQSPTVRTTGVRERCIEWIAKRAAGLGEGAGE